jgi:hypothetical protein
MKKVLIPVLILMAFEMSAQTKTPVKKTTPKPSTTGCTNSWFEK